MPNDPLSQMLPNSGYAEEPPGETLPEDNPDLQLAFDDFDNPELTLAVRADALKLILELTE
jgi:hypothetical protein